MQNVGAPLKWRFIAVFMVLSAGIIAVGAVFYARQRAAVEAKEKSTVFSIAELKRTELTGWWKERLGDAETIFENSIFIHQVEKYLTDRKNAHLRTDITDYLNSLRKNYDYVIVRLLDTLGEPVISDPSVAYPLSKEAKGVILRAVNDKKVTVSDLEREEKENVIHIHIAVPLIDRHAAGEPVKGAVLLAVDPVRFLFPLVQSWPVPSATAETLLVEREGDEIVYLNELRHKKDTALKLRIPVTTADLPAARAVGGFEGVMWGRDYRGVGVLAAVLPVGGTPWFIVAKIDASEVFAPLRRVAAGSMIFAVLLIIISGMSLKYYWQKQQTLSEEALRVSEERYGTLLDISPEAFFVNRGNRIEYVNRAAMKLLGAERHDDVVGKTPFDLFHPDYHAVVGERIRVMLEQGRQVPLIEEKIVRLDGTVVDVEVAAGPFTDERGPAIMVFLRDITDRKRAETELRDLNETLEKRVKERTVELESFSYSVSHDLRAPLRAIDGFSVALADDCLGELGDKGKEHLKRIRRGVSKMGGLIDDMLTLSRVAMAEMRRERIDLGGMAEEIVSSLKETEPERKVEFVAAKGLTANGDSRLIRVLLGNLIGNAWKFTSKSPNARIELGADYIEGVKVFFVKDNGAGFDMSYADKLFTPFQRLHSESEFGGSGIGLASARRIVARHGGNIWAEASPDKGATVYFTL